MYNKIIWSEGMFLHPHHFQQQERYFEFLNRKSIDFFHPYPFGFDHLELDLELLLLNKIGLKQCRGIFPDGTLFDIPNSGKTPSPIDIPLSTSSCVIYLAMPLQQTGIPDATSLEDTQQPIRYLGIPQPISDRTSTQQNETMPITLGYPRLKLLSEFDKREAYSCIGIAKINQVTEGKGIILDESYIPPVLNAFENNILKTYINEITTLLHHRSQSLVSQFTDIEEAGVSDLAHFMLLQLVNRYRALFNTLSPVQKMHPFALYQILSQLYGEILTFDRTEKEYSAAYNHQNLFATFSNLMLQLRHHFLNMIDQNVQAFPLDQHKPYLWITNSINKVLFDTHDFVLAVRSHIPPEELRNELPNILKIGPFEEIMDLVTYALPGISIAVLPTAPRKIPFHAGYTYFELQKHSPLWHQLKNSSGLAFHLSAPLPDVHVELWAIQRSHSSENIER